MFWFLKNKTIFKIWNFCFAQILREIVEKQHVLTPLNFFFKFLHCLTLFPIFLVPVNWIVFYVTLHLFKFYYQQTLRQICHIVTKAEHECNNLVWNWKMEVDKNRVTQKQPFADVFKIDVLKNCLRVCKSIKRRFQHKCFPVNIAKCLRTAFFIEHLRWLFLITAINRRYFEK